MSTVRSKEDLLAYDLKHTLGFVSSPRRFNGEYLYNVISAVSKTDICAVAVTRAKALLIVVGNPAVLGLDPLWRRFLNFVYRGGGWTGSSGPTWDPNDDDNDDDDELAEHLNTLSLSAVDGAEEEPDELGWVAEE